MTKQKKRQKTDIEWWTERINDLKGLSKEAQQICPEVAQTTAEYNSLDEEDDVGDWSLLKLCALRYYLEVYTNIAKEHFDKVIYIDLFAGDGFNYLRGVNDSIVGSPLIAHIIPRKTTKKGKNKAFDKMILVELNKRKAKCLHKLVEKGLLPSNTKIFNCNANSPEVMDYIKKELNDGQNNHFLAFVDPYSMQIHWNTLKELFSLNGDLIINFMASSIGRPWGNYYSKKAKIIPNKETFDKFFGDDSWLSVSPKHLGSKVSDLFPIYRKKIQSHREIVKEIEIRGNQGKTFYYMLFAIKETSKNSPWVKSIDVAKHRIEKVNDDFIKRLFKIYRNEQSMLDSFY